MPKPKCPRCGKGDTIPIVYGLPSKETHEAALSGELELGGCEMSLEKPRRHCKHCHKDFGGIVYDYIQFHYFEFSLSSFFGNGQRYFADIRQKCLRSIAVEGSFSPQLRTLKNTETAKFVRNLKSYKEQIIDSELWNSLSNGLESLELPYWQKSYSNPLILDGEQWELKLKFKNRRVLVWSGSNAYPPYYRDLLNLVDKIFGTSI